MASLNLARCAYPIGDPRAPGFGYCGQRCDPSRPGTPYCVQHHNLCHVSTACLRPLDHIADRFAGEARPKQIGADR